MKIRAVGDRVLVKLKAVEEVSKGGIVVIANNKTAHHKSTQDAKVIGIGPQAWKAFGDGSPWCAVGDEIIMTKYSGDDRKLDDSDDLYRIIKDEDVLGVIEE